MYIHVHEHGHIVFEDMAVHGQADVRSSFGWNHPLFTVVSILFIDQFYCSIYRRITSDLYRKTHGIYYWILPITSMTICPTMTLRVHGPFWLMISSNGVKQITFKHRWSVPAIHIISHRRSLKIYITVSKSRFCFRLFYFLQSL